MPRRFLADVALLNTAILWGINLTVVKAAIAHVDPLTFNALRMVLSTCALGVLAWGEARVLGKPPRIWTCKSWPFFALLSGLVYPLLFIAGIERTTAGNTALLLASMPTWTAVLSFIFLRERLPALTWWGLMVSLIGTAVVILAGTRVSLAAEFLLGNIFVIAAAMCWASATVVSMPLLKVLRPLQLAFWASLVTTPIHLSLTWSQIPEALSRLSTPSMAAALIYSGVMSTGLAYATWHFGVRQLGGSHAAVYQNVVTLVAVLSAWLFLQETIYPLQIAGGAVLFIGLYLMRRGRRHRLDDSSHTATDSKATSERTPSAASLAVEPITVKRSDA